MSLAPDSEPCSCILCVDACESRPGWPTPEEAKLLIDAGHANRLMLEWWDADEELPYIEILSPASSGRGGIKAPSTPLFSYGRLNWRCVFLKDGKCELFGQPGRPIECRAYYHTDSDKKTNRLHKEVAKAWNTEEARELVQTWKKLVDYAAAYESPYDDEE